MSSWNCAGRNCPPSYITDVPAGCGLIRCGGQLVPFTNAFPTGTDLYKLMTTKPDEMMR